MKERAIFSIGLALASMNFFISCQEKKDQLSVSLKALAPTVIEKNGTEIFQYWEFENDPTIWNSSLIPLTDLQAYKDSLENVLGKDTFNLILQNVFFQDISYQWINTENGDSINAQLVHANTVGKIRIINLLEAQLLDYQLARYPLLSHPTEFHGFILLHDSLNLVRVYFAASDQPWPPKPNVILEAIKNDLTKGWNLKYHLHNHYEPAANHYIGILAPSMADAQYFKFLAEDYGLEKALITNGFHTLEVKNGEFQKFKSHGDN